MEETWFTSTGDREHGCVPGGTEGEIGRGRGRLGGISYWTVGQRWGFTEEVGLEFPFGCCC
jgi:hypothetical protein